MIRCTASSSRRALVIPAACLLLAGAALAQDAYRVQLGPDAALGLWAVWETASNEVWIEAVLEPLEPSPPPIQLIDLVLDWDEARLEAVGNPEPGLLFDGLPNAYHNWYDDARGRTFTSVLLGLDEGVAPAAPVTVMRQKFHALDPAGGLAAVSLASLTLRDTDNHGIPGQAAPPATLSIDVEPPAGYVFDVVSQNPAGDQSWTAQALVDASLVPGDGTLFELVLAEDGAPLSNLDPRWTAPPAPTTFTLSAGDGLKTVRAHLRDEYGNRSAPQDQIVLDTHAPGYHVFGFEAHPRHQGVLLVWQNPIAPDFGQVHVWRHGWSDGGTPRYPEYDDVEPMGGWPLNEAQALSQGFVPVFAGAGESWLDPVLPRDVYRYVAFCVDLAGNVGAGAADARDRSTNYILGDVWTPWDGTVYVRDLVRLSAGYATAEGEPFYNNQLDYGPTDDTGREGVPLTDSEVGFEDLMIFAMNYGQFGPPSPALEDSLSAILRTRVIVRDGERTVEHDFAPQDGAPPADGGRTNRN